ncbi:unnamed protein product, partial [Cylicostephanus goldi]
MKGQNTDHYHSCCQPRDHRILEVVFQGLVVVVVVVVVVVARIHLVAVEGHQGHLQTDDINSDPLLVPPMALLDLQNIRFCR